MKIKSLIALILLAVPNVRSAEIATPPKLNVSRVSEAQLQFAWTSQVPGYFLEATRNLSSEVSWSSLTTPIESVGDQHMMVLENDRGANRYFRLRRPLTTLGASSPGYGERGVSVTRETIIGFTRTASLFHLEPLPGSTRIIAVFDGKGIADEHGFPLDPDGDGVAGGSAVLVFDTKNFTLRVATSRQPKILQRPSVVIMSAGVESTCQRCRDNTSLMVPG